MTEAPNHRMCPVGWLTGSYQGELFFSEPHHHLRERRSLYLLPFKNPANRFAIKSCLFGCFPQSTQADRRDYVGLQLSTQKLQWRFMGCTF